MDRDCSLTHISVLWVSVYLPSLDRYWDRGTGCEVVRDRTHVHNAPLGPTWLIAHDSIYGMTTSLLSQHNHASCVTEHKEKSPRSLRTQLRKEAEHKYSVR